jgi:hypothetical protein
MTNPLPYGLLATLTALIPSEVAFHPTREGLMPSA